MKGLNVETSGPKEYDQLSMKALADKHEGMCGNDGCVLMDPPRVKAFFGRGGGNCNVDGWKDQHSARVKVAIMGVPVRVRMGRDLRQEMVYGNHRRMMKYIGDVFRKTMSDMAVGLAMLFDVEVKKDYMEVYFAG